MRSVRAELGSGDLGQLITRLHADAVWIPAGDPPTKYKGRETVSAALEERTNGMCMDPRPLVHHEAVIVVEVRPDSGPRQGSLYRALRFEDDRVSRIEDFEDREGAFERAGEFLLSLPAGPDWLEKVCDILSVDDRRRLKGLLRLVRRPEVPAKYGVGRRELVADSLGALQIPAVRDAGSIADVGSGYGFPGLVLGAVLDAEVRLIEKAPERCAFLRMATGELGLRNVEVVEGHVEALQSHTFDVVTVRNVARLNTVVEWAAPLVRLEGAALFWTRRRDAAEEADGLAAAAVTGLELQDVLRTHPWSTRQLYVFRKTGATPSRFPRSLREARRHPITGGDG